MKSRESQEQDRNRNRRENGQSCEPRKGRGVPSTDVWSQPCHLLAVPAGCLTALSLSYLVETRATVPTFSGLLRGLSKITHAKHVAYFLSELVVGVQLKYAIRLFCH